MSRELGASVTTSVVGVAETAEPVRPRMQHRDPRRPRNVGDVGAAHRAQQLLAAVSQRVARHPVLGGEGRLEAVRAEDYQCTPFMRWASTVASPEAFSFSALSP